MPLSPVRSLQPALVLTRPGLGIRVRPPVPPTFIQWDISASGGSVSSGSASLTMLAAIAATGASAASGSGALRMLAAIAAAGSSSSAGSAALLMLAAIAASGGSTAVGAASLTALMAIAAAGASVSVGSGRIDFPPMQDFEVARLAVVGVTAEVRTL